MELKDTQSIKFNPPSFPHYRKSSLANITPNTDILKGKALFRTGIS